MTSEEARLLRFALNYPGWHSFARGQRAKTRRALISLEHAGALEIIPHPAPAQWQFRIAQPKVTP